MFCKDGWKIFGAFFVVSLVVFSWSGVDFSHIGQNDGGLTGYAVDESNSVSFTLNAGDWTMVSVPFSDFSGSGCDSEDDSVWAIHYDSVKGDYGGWIAREDFDTQLNSGFGYWMYYDSEVSESCTLTFTGTKAVSFDSVGEGSDGSLSSGANMIGVGKALSLKDYAGDCVFNDKSLVWYDHDKIRLNSDGSFAKDDNNDIIHGDYAYVKDLVMTPEKAYWLITSNTCKLGKVQQAVSDSKYMIFQQSRQTDGSYRSAILIINEKNEVLKAIDYLGSKKSTVDSDDPPEMTAIPAGKDKNGKYHFLISDWELGEVREIDEDGKLVWSFYKNVRLKSNSQNYDSSYYYHIYPVFAQRLKNGNTLVASDPDYDKGYFDGQVLEVLPNGEVIRNIPVSYFAPSGGLGKPRPEIAWKTSSGNTFVYGVTGGVGGKFYEEKGPGRELLTTSIKNSGIPFGLIPSVDNIYIKDDSLYFIASNYTAKNSQIVKVSNYVNPVYDPTWVNVPKPVVKTLYKFEGGVPENFFPLDDNTFLFVDEERGSVYKIDASNGKVTWNFTSNNYKKYITFKGTDPNNPDTDGDGIYDGGERSSYYQGTQYSQPIERLDPLKHPVDNDHDGIADLWEKTFFSSSGGNCDPSADPDGDGMSNLKEYLLGYSPTSKSTAPTFTDSDNDGLSDIQESWEIVPQDYQSCKQDDNFLKEPCGPQIIYPLDYMGPDVDTTPTIKDVPNLPSSETLLMTSGYYESYTNVPPRVMEVDNKNIIKWQYSTLLTGYKASSPTYAQRLTNGNTLITDSLGNRVFEINSEDKMVWQYNGSSLKDYVYSPNYAERLDDGNTLIADSNNHRIIELNPARQVVWQYGTFGIYGKANYSLTNSLTGNGVAGSITPQGQLYYPRYAHKLDSGNILVADSYNQRVIEITPEKKIAWTYRDTRYNCNPGFVSKLSNGNFLITLTNNCAEVDEISPDGKILWTYGNGNGSRQSYTEYNKLYSPATAQELSNGNILISDRNSRMLEIDKKTKLAVRKIDPLSKNQTLYVADSNNNLKRDLSTSYAVNSAHVLDTRLAPAYIPKNSLYYGLILLMHLDENPAVEGTIIKDEANKLNYGLPVAPQFNGILHSSGSKSVEGKIGTAINFDGMKDYIEVKDGMASPLRPSNISIAMWCYVESLESNQARCKVSKWDKQYSIYLDSDNKFKFVGGISASNGASTTGIESNALKQTGWHHVAVTNDGNHFKIYVDGKLDVFIPGKKLTMWNGADYSINLGRDAIPYYDKTTIPKYYPGTIDELAIWNRALTSQEITRLYQKGFDSSDLPAEGSNILPDLTCKTLVRFAFTNVLPQDTVCNPVFNFNGKKSINLPSNIIDPVFYLDNVRVNDGCEIVKINDQTLLDESLTCGTCPALRNVENINKIVNIEKNAMNLEVSWVDSQGGAGTEGGIWIYGTLLYSVKNTDKCLQTIS